jgi:serine/threonine protein kinase
MALVCVFTQRAHPLLNTPLRAARHRDIKPENLLLTRPPGAPEGPDGLVLKIIDFGCSTFCAPGKRLCKKFGTVRACVGGWLLAARLLPRRGRSPLHAS